MKEVKSKKEEEKRRARESLSFEEKREKERKPEKKKENPSKTQKNSTHSLTVAPADPVPESLTMILDPSWNTNLIPWFLETEPSTGSV